MRLATAWLAALLALPAMAAAKDYPSTVRAFLARMDTDGDGRISLAEYQDYMSAGFRSMDRNGDGVLEPDEQPAGPRRHGTLTLAAHRAHLAATFRRQDADHDGYLDARELAAPPR